MDFQSLSASVSLTRTVLLIYLITCLRLVSEKDIYQVKTIKKNTMMKLTVHFHFPLSSSLPESMQHHSGHEGNDFTY